MVSYVPERAEGLLDVGVCWADAGDHERVGVAAEGVLQQPSQLGVAVRDVRLAALAQRRDHVAQAEQTLWWRTCRMLSGPERSLLTIG